MFGILLPSLISLHTLKKNPETTMVDRRPGLPSGSMLCGEQGLPGEGKLDAVKSGPEGWARALKFPQDG